MKKYYVIGMGHELSDLEKKHPYEVWLDLQEPKCPIVMMEGSGMGGVGGHFKPSEILASCWKTHLKVSGTEWLVPLCEKAVQANDILDLELVVDAYRREHARLPEVREIR